jgi:ADP-ribosyl-[dinitrogen reductase] hydrolase
MIYERELQVALEAALEAGKILRGEFHREGGPRGHSAHADADTEAEWLIRERLLSQFPKYAYRGEETGSVPAEHSRIWLVDPNDGTSAFLRGARGSAVSIALLEQGIPVVGVVYSFVFPDDEGDLIYWQEGESIYRNEREIKPEWLTNDPERVVVLVSLHRENMSDRILRCIHPYRYQALPSIAYRIALAAAGDGEAAVSWHNPGDWDYAGGHALIRGAGGIFVDESGNEIRYAKDGSSKVKRCFGGAPAIVQDLQRRNWNQVVAGYHAPAPARAPRFHLARLKAGQAVSDAALLSRAQGCFLGLCCADSLAHQAVHLDWTKGRIGIETQAALLFARSLVVEGGSNLENIEVAFAQGLLESESGSKLTWMVPLGIVGSKHSSDWVSRAASVIADSDPLTAALHVLLAEAVAYTVRTGAPASEVYSHVCEIAARDQVEPLIQEALKLSASDGANTPTEILGTFQNVFYHLLHAGSFEGEITEITGEEDPTAIAPFTGALLGAVGGRDSIPRRWRQDVLTFRPDLQSTDDSSSTAVSQFLLPVDLLILSELLLLA